MADGHTVKIFYNQGETIFIIKDVVGLYNAIYRDILDDFLFLLESGHLRRRGGDRLEGFYNERVSVIFFPGPVNNGAFCLFYLFDDMVIFYLFHVYKPLAGICPSGMKWIEMNFTLNLYHRQFSLKYGY